MTTSRPFFRYSKLDAFPALCGVGTVAVILWTFLSFQNLSWILVLARAPGETGRAQVVVSSSRRRIELHPLAFGPSGEASSWLVTASDISRFDRVQILGPGGTVLATGVATHE